MTAAELARVVALMRMAQKQYFDRGTHSALEESQRLEKNVDRCLAIVLGGRPERNCFLKQEMSDD